MITRLTLKISGFELDGLESRMNDFSKPIAETLESALINAQHSVEVSKAFRGSPWPAMAESTVKHGRDPSTLLVDSGDLLNSLRKDGPGNVFEVAPMNGRVGTMIPYAGYQQNYIPDGIGRPFLAWSEDQADEIAESFLKHLLGE